MWFITVMETLEPDPDYIAKLGDTRTWGYYFSRDVAVQALHENWTDMNEHIYGYAILEFFDEGICSIGKDRQLFKWDKNKKGYYEISEPEYLKHLSNFGIG